MSLTREQWRLVAAVSVLALLAHANAIGNGFVLDDRGIILEHPRVQSPATAWRTFLEPYWPASVGGGQYRPIGILAFAIDQAVAGDSPPWFHAVNVAWHALATALLSILGIVLGGTAVGVVAGGIFAVHPVHVEAVANVVGRLELMAGAMALATLLLHRRRSALALATFALALGSKEGAIVIPVLAWLVDRLPGATAPATRRLWIGYAGVTATWGGAMAWALRDSVLSTRSEVFANLGGGERLLTVLSIVPHYARLLLAPFRLSADYEPGVLTGVTTLTPAAIAGGLIALLTVAVLARGWARPSLPLVGLAWVVVAIAPVANVVVVTGVALAERTLYLASAGVALVLGWGASRLAGQPALRRAAVVTVLAAFTWRTWTRTPTWRDSRTLALQLLEDHPESYRGHWVAARVLRATGDLAAADREFRVARSIHAFDPALLREAGEVARALGREGDAISLHHSADSLQRVRAR